MPILLDPGVTSLPTYLSDFFQKTNGTTSKKSLLTIGNSSKVSGIEVRMLPPFIKKNGKQGLFGGEGYAEIYCLTLVVSDLPNQVIGGIDLQGFPRIGDMEPLPINKTIFYWQSEKPGAEKGPNQVHFISRVIRSRQGLRNAGQIMADAKNDKDYKSIVQNIGSMLKKASAFTAVSEGIFTLTAIIGKYLGKVEDKDLGTVINSYTTLHGDFDKLGINRYNYPTTKVDFSFELVVRDAQAGDGKAVRGLAGRKIKQPEVKVDLIPL